MSVWPGPGTGSTQGCHSPSLWPLLLQASRGNVQEQGTRAELSGFSGFETAPGTTVPRQTPAFAKIWLWPTARPELYQAEGAGIGLPPEGMFLAQGECGQKQFLK